jgi:hypothetical protein
MRVKLKFLFFILSLCIIPILASCHNSTSNNNHTHSYVEFIISPTCTEDGYTLCKCECGEEFKKDIVSSLGHDLGDWEIKKYPTETEEGLKIRKCSRCNYEEKCYIPFVSHTHIFNIKNIDSKYIKSEATCTEKAFYYYSCGCGEKGDQYFEVGDPLGHLFLNYILDNNASCTKNGTETSKCSRCDITDTREIPNSKTSHSFTHYISDNNATYEKDGTKTAKCDYCSAKDTVVDEGSRLNSRINFKTLTITEDNLYSTKVGNSIENFSFINEIEVIGIAKFVVSSDIYGSNQFATKVVPLEVGNNHFYIIEMIDEEPTSVYEVNIRRREIYRVTFNSQGGTAVENQLIEEDSLAIQPVTPTKKGYTFNKWAFDFSIPITKNINISAEWTANIDTKYKVEYYFENIEDTNYTLYETDNLQGITDTTANAEIKNFEHFTYIENKGNLSGNISANEDLVLKVYYSRNTYTVAFDLGKGEINYNSNLLIQTIKYNGSAKDISNIISLKGASFNSWDKSLNNIDKDITIKAIWDYITYHITFNDTTFNNVVESIDYTVEQTPLKLPELKSYTKVLKGWRAEGNYIFYNEITKDNLGDYDFISSWEDIIKPINYNNPNSYSGYTHWVLTDTAKEKCTELNVIEFNKLIANSSYKDLPLKLNGCQKLETLIVPPNKKIEEYFKDWEYDNSYNIDYSYGISGTLTEIKYSSYYPNSLKTLHVIGDENNSSIINSIGGECKIENLYIEGVKTISDWAFAKLRHLTYIELNDNIESIEQDAFYLCINLKVIKMPLNLASIDNKSFNDCYNINKIYLNKIEDIQINGAFIWNCENAIKYIYSSTKPTTEGNYWHYDSNGNIEEW